MQQLIATVSALTTSVSALTKFQTEVETEKKLRVEDKVELEQSINRTQNKKLTVVGIVVAAVSTAIGYLIDLLK